MISLVLAVVYNTAIQVSLSAWPWRRNFSRVSARPPAKRFEFLCNDDEVLLMFTRSWWLLFMNSSLRVLRDAHGKQYGVTILGNQAILSSLMSGHAFFSFGLDFLCVVASVKTLYDCFVFYIYLTIILYILQQFSFIFCCFSSVTFSVETVNCARVLDMKWTCSDFCSSSVL